MIGSTKRIANTTTMGKLAMSARLIMMEVVLIPSFIYNAEAFATLTNEELSSLEGVQATYVKRITRSSKLDPLSPPFA